MKALFLAIPLCMALLTSCAHAPVTAAPAAPEGEPLIANTQQLESVIYRDFDETWYVINTGDRGFSQVETALSQLHGEPCDSPGLTGCYDFSFTLGDADHDLVLTSGNNKSYVNLDGQWYQTDLNHDIEQSLVKLLLSKGDPIPKEQWIHNPDYVSLSVLLRNNSGISGQTQTTSVFVWAFGCGFILFKLLGMLMPLRVSPEEELKGLDIPEHGADAYSGFQIFINE